MQCLRSRRAMPPVETPGASAITSATCEQARGSFIMRLSRSQLWPIALLAAVTLPAFVSVPAIAADYFPPPDADGGWRTCKDAAEVRDKAGLDPARLEQAYEFTQRSTQNGGLLVVRHGYLAFERY